MAGEKLNAEQLAEGEALAKAATKGPWEVTYGSDSPAGHGPTFEFAYADTCDGERLTPSMRHEDAALIAWMRNNLPALLATAREVERGWEALGISEEDRAENDDPDCETLSQCITVALGYERDQLTEARAEVERLRAELATANHWRDRHAKDSEAYAAQSQTNWTRAESAERECASVREAWEKERAGFDAAEALLIKRAGKSRERADSAEAEVERLRKTGDANAYTIAAICESLGPNIGSSISESVRQIKARAESAEREREEMRVALQFYAEGKCRCGVEYQAGERARAALKGGK